MRKVMIAGLAVLLFAAVSTAFAVDEGKALIKFGGGVLYNNKAVGGKSAGGGHIAIDFNVPGKRIAFSPLADVYRKSGVTTTWAGANVLFKPPTSSDKASVYFGAGGGVLKANKGGKAKGSFDVVAGADIKLAKKVSFFVEPRYVWAASKTLNGVTAHAGLAFHVK